MKKERKIYKTMMEYLKFRNVYNNHTMLAVWEFG